MKFNKGLKLNSKPLFRLIIILENDGFLFSTIVFPEGFRFSLKNKECRTSKMNIVFDLTSSFKDAYGVKIKKTQIQKVLESRIVAGTGLEPVTFGL